MLLGKVLAKRGFPEGIPLLTTYPRYTVRSLEHATNLFIHALMQAHRFGVLFDVDTDGLCAGKIIYEFIKKIGYHPEWYINTEKKHGLHEGVFQWACENQIQCLLIVDAATNDIEWHTRFQEAGITLIVLDHHEIDVFPLCTEERTLAIVNVNYKESPNPHLSGAGVTYRFIRAVAEKYGFGDVSVYEPWVGLSIIADICSMADSENRYYVSRLYDEYQNIPLFRSFSFYGSLRNLFTYSVIPTLNALIRVGKEMDAVALVLSNHPKEIQRLLQEAKLSREIQRQMVDAVLSHAKVAESSTLRLVRMTEDACYPTISGLVANRVLDESGKPTLVVYKTNEGVFKGSFRGKGPRYRDFLRSCGVIARGHQFACGIEIPRENPKEVIQRVFSTAPPLYEEPSADVLIEGSRYFSIHSQLGELALFNEMTGKDMEPIRIRWKLKTSALRASHNGKKVEWVGPYFKVVDFSGRPLDTDSILTEPSLGREGVVLYRV